MSISFRASATSTAGTITVPATAQAGDIAVLVQQTSSASDPGAVDPAGWTPITGTGYAGTPGTRWRLAYKKLAAGDIGASITGMDGDTDAKIMMVFSGSVPIDAVSVQDVDQDSTGNDPVAQTISAASGVVPLVVFGFSGCNDAAATFTTASPAFDSQFTAGNLRAGYKIYNSSPADHTIDKADQGQRNYLASFYMQITEQVQLTANAVATGVPSVGNPALTGKHTVVATPPTLSGHSVGNPALTGKHTVVATSPTFGPHSVGNPALTGKHTVVATAISLSWGTWPTPAFAAHALTATALSLSWAAWPTPVLTGKHTLVATPPTLSLSLGNPVLTGVHTLVPTSLILGSLGSDLVTNGGFSSDTSWAKGTGWSISGGVASRTAAGVASNLVQAMLTVGKEYEVTFDLVVTAGGVGIYLGNAGHVGSIFASGTYTLRGVAAGDTGLYIQGNAAFAGSVDNVSVRQRWGHTIPNPTVTQVHRLAALIAAARLTGSNLAPTLDFINTAAWNSGTNGVLTETTTGWSQTADSREAANILTGGAWHYFKIVIAAKTGSTYFYVYAASQASSGDTTQQLLFETNTDGAQTLEGYFFIPSGKTWIRLYLAGNAAIDFSEITVKALAGDAVTLGQIVLPTPTLTGQHIVVATPPTLGPHETGEPVLTQAHVVTANGIALGWGTWPTPALTGKHTVVAVSVTFGPHVLPTPRARTGRFYIGDSGAYKLPTVVEIGQGESYQDIAEVWYKQNGVWQQLYK